MTERFIQGSYLEKKSTPDQVYCVYELVDGANVPFYVGMTSQDPETRLTQHVNAAERGDQQPKSQRIRSMWRLGTQPRARVIESEITQDEAKALEINVIRKYLSASIPLTNVIHNYELVQPRTDKARLANRRAQLKRWNPDLTDEELELLLGAPRPINRNLGEKAESTRVYGMQRTKAKNRMRRSREVDEQWLDHGLCVLFGVQEYVSSHVPGCIPEEDEEPDGPAIAAYTLAMTDEIMELARELQWHPWKDSKPIDTARVLDEVADVLAFLGILLVYVERKTGCTMADVAKAYSTKTALNIARLNGNVDGYRDNVKNHTHEHQ